MIVFRVRSRLPNASDEITDAKTFLLPKLWYRFFEDISAFMKAVRGAPKQIAQADLTAFAVKLGTEDAGLQLWVTGFDHLLRWSGTGWAWAPGDPESGFYVEFETGAEPTAAHWQLADGTAAITFLKSDGTIGTVTVATAAGFYFRR